MSACYRGGMVTKLFTCQVEGMSARLVEVETDILMGLSAFTIVGLGDAAVHEAKERVRSAIKNSGAQYPQQKKVINLAPAHTKKYGPHFDLPMALGLLVASKQVSPEPFRHALIAGELALDGSVRAITGAISLALFAQKNGWKKLIVPQENVEEASLVEGLIVEGIGHLAEVTQPEKHHRQQAEKIHLASSPAQPTTQNPATPEDDAKPDLADIHGQEQAKRALIIAAVGGHHMLMCGPPGIGKTMLGKAFAHLLPPLEHAEALEVLQIHSVAGILRTPQPKDLHSFLTTRRPFRSVHPTGTLLALTGGGTYPRPGEISLAHHGVLFLDEFSEFPRSHLESLRMPLEDQKIIIARSAGTVIWPAAFTLIAAMNPCPCGYFGDPQKPCTCRPYQRQQYSKKISGPILDRIDLWLQLERPRTTAKQSEAASPCPPASSITSSQARAIIQRARFRRKTCSQNSTNFASASPQKLPLHSAAADLLESMSRKEYLSERAKQKIARVAETIAHIEEHTEIQLEDIAEACQYRRRS